MKKNYLLLIPALALTMTSCDAIMGIFKAGAWFGVIAVVVVVGLVIWLLSKMFGSK